MPADDRQGNPWDIKAGELRQQITLETGVAAAPDTTGGVAINWPTAADGTPTGFGTSTVVRCKIETLSGDKLTVARQLVPDATHQVTLRYRQALDPYRTAKVLTLNRLRFKQGSLSAGRGLLGIGHVNDVEEMHVKLVLTCVEQRS